MTTVESKLAAGLQGLSAAEVAAKRVRGEVNATANRVSRSYRRILFDNAVNPVYAILYVISIVLVSLGLFLDALMTAGLVLINVGAGAFQEARAKRRLDQISLLVRPKATVIRGGSPQAIQPAEIVVGDLLLVESGDELQVDGLVVREEGFNVDESLLTGESDAVRKHPGDRVFSGTFVTAGSAVYEADRVGAESVAQQLTAKARSYRNPQTPLQREVSLVLLGMAITVAVIGLAVVGSFLDLYGHLPLKASVRAAAVMVALIPQGLTFMVTLTYAMAAVRIASTGALVQRLNAIESMSHIDVLCTDKTGTLTTNQLRFEAIRPLALDADSVERLLAAFAASATLRNRTTEAILAAMEGEERQAVLEVPFDSARKWSALAFDEAGLRGIYILGAPEALAPALEAGREIDGALAQWTGQGLRVLLFARQADLSWLAVLEAQRLPEGLEALALVALRDELRTEAGETVAQFARTGIALKVLSGDHPETVAALARQTGIDAGSGLASGPELDKLDDAAFSRRAEESNVFGRITPDHKERLVEALQKRGRYVAMIGDGVNDIPALKRSNVSVAMRSGSPATRSTSDIVLLSDSFAVLPAAFREGQRIRNGMQAILRPFLVRTISVSLIILGAAVLGHEFPTTPRQAGLPAFFTVGIPALVLAIWAKPERTRQYLLPASAGFLAPAALLTAIAGIAVYAGFLRATDNLAAARTALTVTSVACGALLLPFVTRPTLTRGLAAPERRLTALTATVFGLLLIVLVVSPVRAFYELEPLTGAGYAAVAFAVASWAVALHFVWRIGSRIRWPRAVAPRRAALDAPPTANSGEKSSG